MIYLIGGNGFVGSAFARLFGSLKQDYRIITRENAETFKGTSCDLLINANGNSKKFMATRDPLWELDASVMSVARSLDYFDAKRYVLLSTGDVYPQTHCTDVTNEDQVLDVTKMSRYGLHKYMAETLVRGVHPNHIIMRMGGFIGENLSKNAIFDMLTGGDLWLGLDSNLQFINTDDAALIVFELAQNDAIQNEIINLGALGKASLQTAYDLSESKSVVKEGANAVQYELNLDKLASLYTGDLPNSQDIVAQFIKNWKH